MARKKPRHPPEDPRVVADRERWLGMIDRATLVATQAMIEAHLKRELRLARKPLLEPDNATEAALDVPAEALEALPPEKRTP